MFCTCSNVSTKDIDNNSDDDSDDNFEEDSDGKDEGDGSMPETSPSQSAPQIYKVLSNFKAEQEGDLSVRVNGRMSVAHCTNVL